MSIARTTHFIYTVQPGDTIYALAQRFMSSVPTIEKANFLRPPVTDPGLIFPGQLLVIPSKQVNQAGTAFVVSPGDSLYFIAQRFSTYPDLLAGINPEIYNPHIIFPGHLLRVPVLTYEVEEDETLNKLSNRFGVSLSAIMRANQGRPGFSPDVIWPGYRLLIPLPTSQNIAVFAPLPGTVIRNNQRLMGWARAYEANVLYQVRDSNDVVVSEERFTTAQQGAPAYGQFTATLPFDQQPTSHVGEVWVYTRSAKDGSIQDLVQVKVYFR